MPNGRWAAHRGGAALWPENSLLAFRRALALGAPLVECDVQLTVDGGLVVIHDRTLERTTEGAGLVGDHTTDELRRLRLRDREGRLTEERVPTLRELLELIAPTSAALLLEVKGPGPPVYYERRDEGVHAIAGPRYEDLEARMLAVLDETGMRRRTSVLAFNPDVIRTVRALAPEQRTTLLAARGHLDLARASIDELLDVATALGASDLGVEHTLVDPTVVAAAHGRGLTLGVWTVDDPELMRGYAALGVDIVTTDRPDIAVEVFGR